MTINTVAGRYTLVREIGRGGAGSVWLAQDDVLGRQVAMKRIGLPPGAADADVIRADREARLAARVIHPRVVAVFDFVEERDQHWLVMEYIPGSNLAEQIHGDGPLAPDAAARVIRSAAEGLAAAHELGIVHRDVKPSNILVGTDGGVKLTDFGIARGVTDMSLTQTGLVTGSPAFLAPEVARGASANSASDVWALGATLYHALAGHPPYDAGGTPENVLATLYRIAHEEPPRLDTESWLGSVLEATMTRNPEARPSAAEVAAYLAAQDASADHTRRLPLPAAAPAGAPAPPPTAPRPARTARRRARRPLLLAAAAVAVVAVIGILLLVVGDGDDPTPSAGRVQPSASATTGDPSGDATSESTAPAAPTAAELEAFARDYVTTASSDPDAGLRMLTPAYRAQSPNYRQFWGSMRNPRILQLSADPDRLTVSYKYRYELPGVGVRTEDVALQLVQRGDQLLISGAG